MFFTWCPTQCTNLGSEDRCRFDHPVGQGTSQPPKAQNTRPPPQNRYAPLQPTNAGFGSAPRNNGPGFPRNNAPARRSRDSRDRPYGITRQTLEDDLRAELPQWIMSAYGPGKDAPRQLFGGFPREQSFEELRVQHYLNMASGNPQQTVSTYNRPNKQDLTMDHSSASNGTGISSHRKSADSKRTGRP